MSQERKKLLVIGACLTLLGLLISSSKVPIAVGLLNAHVVFGMGWGPDDAAKIGLVGLVGLGCIVGGIVFGIVGFMRNDVAGAGSGTTAARYCSNCGSPIQAGAQFCVTCGVAIKAGGATPAGTAR